MDEYGWADHTSVGDLIEIQYHAGNGRYRWRPRAIIRTRTRFDRMMDTIYDETPWSQRDVPANLRPHWMKTENLNG